VTGGTGVHDFSRAAEHDPRGTEGRKRTDTRMMGG
jgi:hypothetical protein